MESVPKMKKKRGEFVNFRKVISCGSVPSG